MSLRRRLVAGVLVLLVAAVLVTDVVTLSSLRSYLYGRLDEQNDVAQSQANAYIETEYHRALAAGDRAVQSDPEQWLEQLAVPSSGLPGLRAGATGPAAPAPVSSDVPAAVARAATGQVPRAGRLLASVLADRASPDIYIEVLDGKGQVLFRRPSGSAEAADPPLVLPRPLVVTPAPPVPRFGTSHGPYLSDQANFTTGAKGRQGAYYYGEALAVPGGVLVTAAAIAPSNQTLASLSRVELFVSLGVVLLMLVLALWTVRIGLRPLEDMTDTARAISDGDLRRRIRRSDSRTEVGRLGEALNGMLSQIEAAFAERTSSEARLRRFVADASHELRTPLTSIRGYAELLRKGALEDDSARRRAAERIEHEAARMGVLVDDLLLLARLDQGRPLERVPVELSALVGEAVEAAAQADAGHPVTLSLPEPLTVEGDAGRLRQVVDNLLHNASVHTPPGTPVLVSLARHGDTARLTVADEGPGLSPEETRHVFDRFYRGAGARGRPGTGLGLSIVSALAVAHGGRAQARPRPDGGAEFIVELPLDPSAAPAVDDDTMAVNGPRVGEPASR